MTLHAVDDIDDAIDATKSFLSPFDWGTWLRMAFVVFFIGGGGGMNMPQNLGNLSDFGENGGPGSGNGDFSLIAPLESVTAFPGAVFQQVSEPGAPSELPDEVLAGIGMGIIILLALIVLLALVYGLLSNFMEFVFTQALIEREIHVRRYFKNNVGNGVRLLVFRLALGLLWLLLAIAAGAFFFFVIIGTDPTTMNPGALLASSGLLLVGGLFFFVVYGIIYGFTTVFVVPLMIEGEHGVIAGWSRLWRSITAEPKQYLAYFFFSIVLQIGVGIVGAILGIIAFIVVAIPFGLLGFVLWIGLGGGGTAALIGIGIVATLFVLAMIVVSSLIQAPLETFMRYYAMLVLGDIDGDLDPLPEVREDIRPA